MDFTLLDAAQKPIPLDRLSLPQQPPVMTELQKEAFVAAVKTGTVQQAAIPFAEALLGLTGLTVV